ncbi:hypothetical protein ACHQM5_026535 [Ranunculus cassubicifolius]
MSDFDFFRSSKNVFKHVSDDEEVKMDMDECESVNQDGTSAWSSVFEETKDLIRVHENRRSSFCQSVVNHEDRKGWKGSRIKSKPKFSFGFRSEASMPLPTVKNENSVEVHQDVEGLEELEHGGKDHSMTELLKHIQKERSECEEVKIIERPIAELLENLLESHCQQRGTPKMNKEAKVKRSSVTSKRNRSASLSYSTLDNGDHIEPMGVSSDEEAEKFRLQVYDDDRIKTESLEISGRTMTDKFQEVINAATVNDQGMLSATSKQTGYFSRLQQVMQTEKERHMEFLNQSRGAIPRDEARFLDVKILSRYLDAKLTVCQCLLSQNASLSSECLLNSQIFNEDIELRRTVIFSSRICNNVDLEVGNIIRIHPPWKVVEVPSKDGGIILCTYFSQICI